MSESRPSRLPLPSGAHSVRPIRPFRRAHDRGWFVASLAVHVLALLALVYLTPVREIVREIVERTRPQATMSAQEIDALAESIEFRTAERVQENAEELDRVLGEMAEIQGDVAQNFLTFDEQRRRSAAEDALQEMEQAVEQMQEAARSIERGATVEEVDRPQALGEQAQDRARRKLEMVGFDVSDPARKQRTAIEQHQAAKSAHDAHRDRIDELAYARREVEVVETELGKRREALKRARDAGDSAARQQDLQRSVNAEQKRANELKGKADAAARERDKQRQVSADLQRRAIEAQQSAVDALRGAIEQRSQMLAQLPPSQGGAGQSGESALRLPPSASRDGAEDEAADIGEIYERARDSEDRIAGTLKEVRAMDLAMVRDMELEDARGDIDVVRPVRPDLDRELLREAVRTDRRFEEHKAEMEKALRETTSMVNLAYHMLEMATQSVEKMKFGSGAEADLGEMERPQFELIIRELAMEDVAGRFSDLSGLMAAVEQQEAEGAEEEGAEAGAAALGAMQDIEDLTREGLPEGPRFMLGEDGFDEGDFPQLSPDVPAVGARKMSPGGVPGKWMYIDSWWTLGPFPNPERINIDREFPPDSLVDLDATYVGKENRTIRWRFVQSDVPEVIPADAEEYGIWYAYTEFECDQPRDVWIATGTDDRGTLKINGVPVWISSKRLKGWDIDEVWRRVHFRQGVNRILFRVENGWQHIAFSITLRLVDQQ